MTDSVIKDFDPKITSAVKRNYSLVTLLFSTVRNLAQLLSPRGVHIEKVTISSDTVTVMLRTDSMLQELFPQAVLRTRDGKSFYEQQSNDCRLVWEAK